MSDKELVECKNRIREYFKWDFPFSISYNDAFIALNSLKHITYTIKNNSVQILLLDENDEYIKHISYKSDEVGLLALIWCINDIIKHINN